MQRLIRTAKETVRQGLHLAGIRRRADHLAPDNRRDRFSQIYQSGLWQDGDQAQPLSGRGSSLEATSAIRESLPKVLNDLGSKTILDVGCGDLTWMRTLALTGDYIGVDIVPSVIEANRQAMPASQFLCLDAVTDELPDADTVICREILFHLSFADAKALLQNLRAKPRRWLIATSDTATLVNADIESGDFRLLNLAQAPFRFPKPRRTLEDGAISSGRYLGVWDFNDLA